MAGSRTKTLKNRLIPYWTEIFYWISSLWSIVRAHTFHLLPYLICYTTTSKYFSFQMGKNIAHKIPIQSNHHLARFFSVMRKLYSRYIIFTTIFSRSYWFHVWLGFVIRIKAQQILLFLSMLYSVFFSANLSHKTLDHSSPKRWNKSLSLSKFQCKQISGYLFIFNIGI
jgi:hypothetical protein